MRTILHILTKPEDDLTKTIIEMQRTLAETEVEAVTLSADADYGALVGKIFAADSVEVW